MSAAVTYPSPTSVKAGVLADLLAGREITHLDVWREHGSSRAAHHVLMLRKAGWPVHTQEIEVETSQRRHSFIARYSLHADAIEAAGDSGRRFVQQVAAARGAH